jgi:hypothetical protein
MSETNSLQSDILNASTNHLATPTSPSVASRASHASRASSASPTIQINNIEYEIVEMTLNKRGKTSWIWKEGFKLLDLSSEALKKSWMCRRCYKQGTTVMYASNSTSHPSNHLKDVHGLTEDGPISIDASDSGGLRLRSQSSFNFEHFKELLIQWIVIMHISFS